MTNANGHCSLPDCGLKDGLACELGHSDETKCHHFQLEGRGGEEERVSIKTLDSAGQRLPWTGRALGLSDMMLVSARSPAKLIGLIGPFNAGKTSLLTSLFAHFSNVGSIDTFSFAGSYTIDAWARLKQYTQWPATNGPCFPPHTPDKGERVPSLLHLAFREGDNILQDLLFTDAPGEWFTRWVLNRTSESARGAQWIVDNATRFLFIIDRSGLAGDDVGTARQETLALARVLAEHRNGRSVGVIWAKSDLPFDDEIEKPMREKLNRLFGPHLSWNLHTGDKTCLTVLSHLLSNQQTSDALKVPNIVSQSNSAFMSFTEQNHERFAS